MAQRIVVFVGPHKTGSTSIEQFFVDYASNDNPKQKLAAFENWTWPMIGLRSDGNALFGFEPNNPRHKNKTSRVKFERAIRDKMISSGRESQNVFFGTENFDKFERTGALDKILDWMNCTTPKMIVNYRSPRMDHWLSWWKQKEKNEKLNGVSFHDFLCYRSDPMPISLDPLFLVERLRNRGWQTYIVDMGGVSKAYLDVSHTIACEILEGVPCHNGWVGGLEQQIVRKNQLDGESGLSKSQLESMELVLRYHDCSLQFLQDHAGVRVVRQDTLWSGCEEYDEHSVRQMRTFSNVVVALRNIMGCENSKRLNKIKAPTKQYFLGGLYRNLKGVGPLRIFGLVCPWFILFWVRQHRLKRYVLAARRE
jgi:hypothetical protein